MNDHDHDRDTATDVVEGEVEPKANGHKEVAPPPEDTPQTLEEAQEMITQLQHYVQLQANTIAAFQNRTIKLEMEIVELMSQLVVVNPQ